jgi:putative transposase
MDYRAGSHSRYDLKVHIVWITKYRNKVLKGDVSHRVRELIREICKANEVEIIKGHVSVDHIHLLVSYPPSLSISKLVQYVKGKTSRRLLQDYTELRKMFWGQHLWARGYFAASVGTVTDEVVKEYIEKQDVATKDDDFKISE